MAPTLRFRRERGFVYAPGPRPPKDDWIAVVADTFVALVEAGPGDRGVDALAALAEEQDPVLERMVSAIPLGEAGVGSFALVRADAWDENGWQITAVGRGRAVVDVFSIGGSRRFSSSGVQPWLIATFGDVIAVELGGPSREFSAVARRAPGALPIGLGAVHAGSVLWSLRPSDPADGGESETGSGYARPVAALDDDTIRRVRGPAGDGPSGMEVPGREGPGSDAPGKGAQGRELLAPPTRPVPATPAPPLDHETFDDETVVRRGARRPVAERADDAYAGLSAEPAQRAVTESERGMPRVPERRNGRPRHVAVPVAVPVLVAVRGQRPVQLEAPIVIGRRPSGSGRSRLEPVLLTVSSPGQIVSASHVRVERVSGTVVVTDLRSRNGTTVVLEGGLRRRLRPGESFAVPGAATIEIGDGTIIDITPQER